MTYAYPSAYRLEGMAIDSIRNINHFFSSYKDKLWNDGKHWILDDMDIYSNSNNIHIIQECRTIKEIFSKKARKNEAKTRIGSRKY